MAETKIQTAKRRRLEQRSHTAAGAAGIARAQENALKQGFTSKPMPESKAKPVYRPEPPQYAPGPPATADAMGGAKDDPNVKIEIGPDGKVVRRKRY